MTNRSRRRALAEETLAGYVHGPEAATEATANALDRVAELAPGAIILVEGISDQIAVETSARRQERHLDDDGVVVLPVGGAQRMAHFIRRFGTGPEAVRLVGLCDAAEEPIVRSGLVRAGLGTTTDRASLARLGFHVCDEDLEDELLRALGTEATIELVERQGELGSFRTLQKQPAWRGRPPHEQLRRFLGSGARRKSRYARLLVEALPAERLPSPLVAVVDDA
ncbi:MAG: TOPRIM nucleotidyl transferase/hydrolase domain-containing protein [Actinomycetota bacterium]